MDGARSAREKNLTFRETIRVQPCMDGARSAREKNLTFRETIRVQPCIRPLEQIRVDFTHSLHA
jgi:hypothetical protein